METGGPEGREMDRAAVIQPPGSRRLQAEVPISPHGVLDLGRAAVEGLSPEQGPLRPDAADGPAVDAVGPALGVDADGQGQEVKGRRRAEGLGLAASLRIELNPGAGVALGHEAGVIDALVRSYQGITGPGSQVRVAREPAA